MTHEQLRELYEFYALGLLEAEEAAEIDEHLKQRCEACLAGVRRATLTNAAIQSLTPDVTPPKQLRRRVLAAAGVVKQNRGWIVGWAAVSAGLLVATLWFSTEAQRTQSELALTRSEAAQSAVELARTRAVLEFLNAPETRQVRFGQGAPEPPRGNVFVNPTSGVLLIASNLPPLDPGKTYEMWVIPKGGAPRPAGLFRSDAQGHAVHIQSGPVDLDATGAVAVSVEPEAGSTAPTTTPIIVAAVAGP
jgi:anti-sigma-K factor RskA